MVPHCYECQTKGPWRFKFMYRTSVVPSTPFPKPYKALLFFWLAVCGQIYLVPVHLFADCIQVNANRPPGGDTSLHFGQPISELVQLLLLKLHQFFLQPVNKSEFPVQRGCWLLHSLYWHGSNSGSREAACAWQPSEKLWSWVKQELRAPDWLIICCSVNQSWAPDPEL